ncbi:MAG: polyphenol oxidase family protein [Spirochaetales bacterium]|nr:polyphenol oxidase family protein [Spirochaetales bacterium]
MSIHGMTKEIHPEAIVHTWNIFAPWRHCMTAALVAQESPCGPLNLAHRPPRPREELLRHRQRVHQALDLPQLPWATLSQIHGTTIIPAHEATEIPQKGDGILLTKPRSLGAVLLADCHPVVIYDPILHQACVCHAGWRGTVAGMAGAAVDELKKRGSLAKNLIAGVGGGIGPCCYPVGEEVVQALRQLPGHPERLYSQQEGVWYANLEEANAAVLQESGVPSSQIGRAGICTACQPGEFHSYRRDGQNAGRHAALFFLK